MDEKEFMTVAEASDYLRCSPQTIIRYINGGYITGYKLPKNRMWYLKRTDVESFMRPTSIPMRKYVPEADEDKIVLYD